MLQKSCLEDWQCICLPVTAASEAQDEQHALNNNNEERWDTGGGRGGGQGGATEPSRVQPSLLPPLLAASFLHPFPCFNADKALSRISAC